MVIKNYPPNKNSGPDGITGEFFKHLKKYNTNPSQTFPKNSRGQKFQTHFMWPWFTLIPKPDKDKKGKLQANIPGEHRWKKSSISNSTAH